VLAIRISLVLLPDEDFPLDVNRFYPFLPASQVFPVSKSFVAVGGGRGWLFNFRLLYFSSRL